MKVLFVKSFVSNFVEKLETSFSYLWNCKYALSEIICWYQIQSWTL